MLTCKEITELATDHLEGRLPLPQRLFFRLHLWMCKHCRAYLQQIRLTIETLRHLPMERIPAEDIEKLLLRLKDS